MHYGARAAELPRALIGSRPDVPQAEPLWEVTGEAEGARRRRPGEVPDAGQPAPRAGQRLDGAPAMSALAATRWRSMAR